MPAPEIYLSEARIHSIATSMDYAATQLRLIHAGDPSEATDLAVVAAERCGQIGELCRHLSELLKLLEEYGQIRRL